MITSLLRILLTRSFKPLIFTNKVKDESEFCMDEFGIYVHIPFCKTLCPFCPYNKVEYDKGLAQKYKEALINEIKMVGSKCKNKIVNSVYFGGGTPALMLDDLEEIIQELKKNFDLRCNIGIELHPRDVSIASLKKLRNIGFNMISIGIQSFQKKCLNNLGREYINGEEKIQLVKEFGFEVIDVDLIFGIKGQTIDDLKTDFVKAIKCGATQVSTYPFIDFSYAKNKSRPMGRKEKKVLLNSLEKIHRELNCTRTSVWTFGKENIPKYSSITRDLYIGFGPSAATLTKEVFKINMFSVEEYIKFINNNVRPTSLTMKFNKRNRMLYWLFWNAYTLTLNEEEFFKLFGVKLEYFSLELKVLSLLRLIKKIPEGYKLTKRGAYFYHLIEQKYTLKYIDKTWSKQDNNPMEEQIRLY